MSDVAVEELIADASPRIHARAAGNSGPVVLAINGGPGVSSHHMVQLDELVGLGFRVLTYDQRGVGRSEAPMGDPRGEQDFSLPALVSDIDSVRRWAGADRVILLGHSWGGALAMAYASTHPDHVDALLLVDSSGPTADSFRAVRDAFRSVVPSPPPPLPPGTIEPPGWQTISIYYADPARIRVEDAPQVHDKLTAERTWSQNSDYDVSDALRTTTMPTLIVYGAQDPAIFARDAIRASRPDATVVVIDDCGHRPMAECPDRLWEEITEFIDDAMLQCEP